MCYNKYVKRERYLKMKKQIIYLDMDGTIADLYGIENWLERLRNEVEGLFLQCEPLITESELLVLFPNDIYELRICSMTPMNASKEYCVKVIEEKNIWLDKHFPSIKKRTYLEYGYNKNIRNSKNHILIDDNKTIRENYRGLALEPMWV
jgi:5'(3')-deoxyribonucleotidase